MLQIDEVSPALLVVRQILREHHRRDGGAHRLEAFDPVRDRPLAQDSGDPRAQLLDERKVGRVERVVVEVVRRVVVDAQHAADRVAVRLGKRADDHSAVGGRVAAPVDPHRRAGAQRSLARRHEVAVVAAGGAHALQLGKDQVAPVGVVHGLDVELVAAHRQHRAQQGDRDALPLARALAVVERRGQPDRRRQSRREVPDHQRRPDRRAILVDLRGESDAAAVGLRHHVRGGLVRVRPVTIEAADLGVDQVRPDRPQRLVVDAEPLRDARTVVDQHHIELGQQPVHHLATRLLLQVQFDAALSAVHRLEDLGVAGSDGVEIAERLPARRLHLDHVRPEVGEL